MLHLAFIAFVIYCVVNLFRHTFVNPMAFVEIGLYFAGWFILLWIVSLAVPAPLAAVVTLSVILGFVSYMIFGNNYDL